MGWKSNLPISKTKLQDAPQIFMDNWSAWQDFSAQEHESITSSAGSGKHISGRTAVIMVDTTAVILAILNPPACAIAYDTDINIFAYFDGAAWQEMGGGIASGTRMAFYADTAPTGWTLEDINDKMIFITKGSAAGGYPGGAAHPTGVWQKDYHFHTTNACAIDASQMPTHYHNMGLVCGASGLVFQDGYPSPMYTTVNCANVSVDPTGGGLAHDHGGLQGNATISSWRMYSEAFIICTKD